MVAQKLCERQDRRRYTACGFVGLLAAMAACVEASAGEATIPDVPGGEIFGFSTGTDTGDKGERGFANELNGFRGKRDGSFTALSNKLEFGYTLADDLWIAGSFFVSNSRVRGNPDIPDTSTTRFEGLSTEAQHRLIKRSATNPFALAVAVEPFYAFVDLGTGRRADGYGAAFKFLVDAVVVPDRLYWAFNAIWAPVRSQDSFDRSVWQSSSESSLQTALTFQLSNTLFAGAELRHLAAYERTWFDNRAGYATYLGPTVFWKITDKVGFNATWQPQISGRSADNPGLRYDLDNFQRAQFRFKFEVALN
jgi:hypothetical protein